MSKIETSKGLVTQINVFTVAPENMQSLIDLLVEAAQSVKNVPAGSQQIFTAVWTVLVLSITLSVKITKRGKP